MRDGRTADATTVRRIPSTTGSARARGAARISGAALPVRPIPHRRSGGPRPDRLSDTPPLHVRARPRSKPVAAALDKLDMQNCNGLRGLYHLRYRRVPARVQHHVEACHQDPEEVLHFLAKRLLHAVESQLLSSLGVRIRGDEKCEARITAVHLVI